jgi:hypothetical protein
LDTSSVSSRKRSLPLGASGCSQSTYVSSLPPLYPSYAMSHRRIRFFSLNTMARSWYLYDMPQIPCMESSYTLSSVWPHSVLPSVSPPRPMITPSMLCSMLGRTTTISTSSSRSRSFCRTVADLGSSPGPASLKARFMLMVTPARLCSLMRDTNRFSSKATMRSAA